MRTIQIPQDLEQKLTHLATQQNLPLKTFIIQFLNQIAQQQNPDDTPKTEIIAGLQRALEDLKAGRLTPLKNSGMTLMFKSSIPATSVK